MGMLHRPIPKPGAPTLRSGMREAYSRCVRPILDARSETVRMQGMYSCRPSLAFTSSDAMLPTPVSVGLSLAVARVTLEIAAVNAPKDGTRIRGNACHVAAMPAFTPW